MLSTAYLQHHKDDEFLSEFVAICARGCHFYLWAAKTVGAQKVRNIFLQAAHQRCFMADDIRCYSELTLCNADIISEPGKELAAWYEALKSHSDLLISNVFEMRNAEKQYLNYSKQRVKAIYNKQMAYDLASNIASLQITQDKLNTLARSEAATGTK